MPETQTPPTESTQEKPIENQTQETQETNTQAEQQFDAAVESAFKAPSVSEDLADAEGLNDRVNPDDPSLGPAPTMDDFLAIKHGAESFNLPKKVEQKKDEVKAKETPAPEKKVETDASKVKETSAADKTKEVTKTDGTKALARDYSAFDEKEQGYLKKMSNDAFAWVKPQLLERKTLSNILAQKDKEIAALKTGKQLLPPNYFEHPQAFVLTPEFNAASNNMNLAYNIQKHWQNQLANIRRGGKWQDADVQNGKLMVGQPQDATPEAEAAVMSYITGAANQLSKFQSEVNNIQQSFASRHNQAAEILKTAEKEHFYAYDDEKHPYAPIVKNLYNNIPEEFRGSPLASLLAKASTAAIQFGNMYKELQAKMVEKDNKIKELEDVAKNGSKRQVQPTEGDIKASASAARSNGSASDVTFDDFKKLKY